MKSLTCFSKKSGAPLTEYDFEFEAASSADYIKLEHGTELIPYHCKKCHKWHLSPKSRQTPSTTCSSCTAGDGTPKETYRSKKEAIMRADILFEEHGVELDAYPCKLGSGWHLTKSHF